MRYFLPVLAVLAVAGCEMGQPNTRSGVGFQDYNAYQQQQAFLARSRGSAPMSAAAPAAAAPAPAPAPVAASAAPAPVSGGAITTTVVAAAPAAAPAAADPTPPQRPGRANTANIAAFALSTSHPIGQPMYSRSNPLRGSQNERACARYPSDSMAQEAFLEAGGPDRDRMNLDPDGDGYACRWDPAAFRLARQ